MRNTSNPFRASFPLYFASLLQRKWFHRRIGRLPLRRLALLLFSFQLLCIIDHHFEFVVHLSILVDVQFFALILDQSALERKRAP